MTQPPVPPLAGQADSGRAELQPERRKSGGAQPLRGRHVAIVGAAPESPSALLFEKAATALGARVSRLGAELLAPADERSEAAMRLLGTLYDAIDGVTLDREGALHLQSVAGIPVFADLGGPESPLRQALRSPDDERELLDLVESVLVRSLS